MPFYKTSRRPLISFTIPTYNFGKFIGETVRSIQNGTTRLDRNDFEIIILDGGSTDETERVISELTTKYTNIRYIRNKTRGGIDHDMTEVANLANGEYIWLFSADDLLMKGWDSYIKQALTQKNCLVLVPAILCDIKMKPLRENPIFPHTGTTISRYYFDKGGASIKNYLHNMNTLEGLFSYMSAVIIKKDVWTSLPIRKDYFGTCWAHCARLIPLLFRKDTTIAYVPKYVILKRGGNDSFMEYGLVNRIGIAIEGWARITEEFFNCPVHQKLIHGLLRRDTPLLLLIYAKISAKSNKDLARLDSMAAVLCKHMTTSKTDRILLSIFWVIPKNAKVNQLIYPLLPYLKKLRHCIKRYSLRNVA